VDGPAPEREHAEQRHQICAERRDEPDREEQGREGELDIRGAHDEGVGPPPGEAREEAEPHADAASEHEARRRDGRDAVRRRCGSTVTAEGVGAERVHAAGGRSPEAA
jgi:hypothetical protein